MALRGGEAGAMGIARLERGGVVVTFFGRPARASAALARLARATGAPVVPVFLVRRGGGFALEVGEPVPLRWSDDYRADLRRATQVMTELVERAIREQPEQWLWLHRRWKGSGDKPGVEAVDRRVARIPSSQG
jgi:KDO2-lipid IV(A) lauroyltransferase